jgi:hypothetical protein
VSNIYGNAIMPHTVPMTECAVFVLELQCNFRIGTHFGVGGVSSFQIKVDQNIDQAEVIGLRPLATFTKI